MRNMDGYKDKNAIIDYKMLKEERILIAKGYRKEIL